MFENLHGKKLLLLGAVQPLCQVIEEAHKMGVLVYATDYYVNSPAKKYADKSFMVSTTDVDAVVVLCKKENIDGVFTGYIDSMLPYCRKICQRLGFPFWASEEMIENCIDKLKFKEMCEDAGVPVVPWIKANAENYMQFIDSVEYPVVVKPVDNSGSRGVFKCFHKNEFESICKDSLSFSAKKEILIEKMMNADKEFSVYYMLHNGNVYFSEMGDRYVTITDKHMAPIGQGMSFPSIHLDDWLVKMEPKMNQLFKKNHMDEGFCFLQGFYDNGDFYVHEIGYRLNGGFSYKYCEALSGYNQVQQMIYYSLTGDMIVSELEKSNARYNKNALTITAGLTGGIIGQIEGVDIIKKNPNVLEFCQLHFEGDKINIHGATARVLAYILCIVENRRQLLELIELINSNLRVYDIDSNNMLLNIIEPDKIHLFYE